MAIPEEPLAKGEAKPITAAMKDAFGATIREAICDRLVQKAAASGVAVAAEERERIERAISEGKYDYRISVTGGDSVVLDESDLPAISEAAEEAQSLLSSEARFAKTVGALVMERLSALRAGWPQNAEARTADSLDFMTEVEELWGGALGVLRLLEAEFFQGGDNAIKELDEGVRGGSTEKTNELDLSIFFHARACQLLKEIVALASLGFAEAALARWRTLHEVHVTAAFVYESGGDMAERYLRHDAVGALRDFRKYEECCEALGYEPPDMAVKADLEERAAELVDKFGTDYKKGDYGWAAEKLGTEKPSFAQIESAAGFGRMRSHYAYASASVHAGPRGTLRRPSQPPDEDGMIAGQSVHGLTDAISCAAVTASQLYALLSAQWCTERSLIASLVINELANSVNKSLGEVRFDDDEGTDGC